MPRKPGQSTAPPGQSGSYPRCHAAKRAAMAVFVVAPPPRVTGRTHCLPRIRPLSSFPRPHHDHYEPALLHPQRASARLPPVRPGHRRADHVGRPRRCRQRGRRRRRRKRVRTPLARGRHRPARRHEQGRRGAGEGRQHHQRHQQRRHRRPAGQERGRGAGPPAGRVGAARPGRGPLHHRARHGAGPERRHHQRRAGALARGGPPRRGAGRAAGRLDPLAGGEQDADAGPGRQLAGRHRRGQIAVRLRPAGPPAVGQRRRQLRPEHRQDQPQRFLAGRTALHGRQAGRGRRPESGEAQVRLGQRGDRRRLGRRAPGRLRAA